MINYNLQYDIKIFNNFFSILVWRVLCQKKESNACIINSLSFTFPSSLSSWARDDATNICAKVTVSYRIPKCPLVKNGMSRKRIWSSRASHINLPSNTGRWEGRGTHLMTGNYYSQEGTESTDPSGCGCFKENSSTSFVRYVHIRRHVCRLRWSQLEMSSSGGIHRHCCEKKRKCDTNCNH